MPTDPLLGSSSSESDVSPSQALRHQRTRNMGFIIGIAVVIGVPMVYLMYKAEQNAAKKAERRNPARIVSVLGKHVDKEAWQADAAARLRSLEDENKRLQSELKQIKDQTDGHAADLSKIKDQEQKAGSSPRENGRDGSSPARKDSPATTAPTRPPLPARAGSPPVPLAQALPRLSGALPATDQSAGASAYTAGSPGQPVSITPPQPAGTGPSPLKGVGPLPPALPTPGGSAIPTTIKVVRADSRANQAAKGLPTSDPTKGSKTNEETVAWLPTGSFVQIQLLSGIDAPTGTSSSGSPYPVLMRITDLAKLPNRFSMDLVDCLVVGSGFGDMSSERAQIRSESMACIRNDGTTIDIPVKGYVAGEDGKVGMRGRLVTRDGAVLAKALLAGFASGISQAFRPMQAMGLFTGQPGQLGFPQPTAVGQSVALGGAGNAAQILAQYYVRMARRVYPIIEVSSGRKADLVITKGVPLTLKDTHEKINELDLSQPTATWLVGQ